MPRKKLGQHFLFDPGILDRIIETASIGPDDTVVEIGPGLGRMTRRLAERARRVVALELDRKLHARLRHRVAPGTNIEPVRVDCLKYPYEQLGPFRLVGNIPYYITTPIIFRLLEVGEDLRSMTLLVQKEVAERIVAEPGTKTYGVLSIMVQLRMQPRIAFPVPAGAFSPPPRVDSAVLHLEPHASPPSRAVNTELFTRVVRSAFSKRRKTIRNGLRPLFPEGILREALAETGIPPHLRPERLPAERFIALADRLAARLAEEASEDAG